MQKLQIIFSFTPKHLNFTFAKNTLIYWDPLLLRQCRNLDIMLPLLVTPLDSHGSTLYRENLNNCFSKFQMMIENQFSTTTKIFQSDGGGEFSSSYFAKHLGSCVILHQFSCPCTPEENGVVK